MSAATVSVGSSAARPAPSRQASAPAPAQIDWTKLLLGFGAMVIGQFMAILDIQIVAASLPQIQAGVSASADQISWIQTAYLIPEVVMIPLSGYLSRLWGTRPVFLMSCAGFVLMSVATGLASDIHMMIVTRALQGFIGGAMIPTVFATAFTAFPPSKRTTASVIIGLIVTLAPTVGPTLGGWLTEALSWRWLFFVNVAPGLLVLAMVWRWGDFDKGDPSLAKGFDWAGLGLMAVFLMSLQYVLEEGAKNDWLDDPLIAGLIVSAVVAGAGFVWRSLAYRQPIVELRAFKDRNFAIGVIMTFVNGSVLFGGTFLLPLFLGQVQGFSAQQVGETMMVSGIAMFLTGPIAGQIARRLDPRIPLFVGFSLAAWGMWMAHQVTPEWGFWQFASVQACRGVGVMIAMIASQNVTMSTLSPHMIKNASGIVNLARNVGGAVGLAVLATGITANTALHLHDLAQGVSVANQGAQDMLSGLVARMQEAGVADPDGAARKAFFGLMQKQAASLAFGDGFSMMALGAAFAAMISLFARPGKGRAAPADAH
ncbi:MAG: DHA2 family efflux MFS transporter permease subunit [Proteobacteria bacterium]|nr:DHA2 family efflux MFS transporter permease subunit [Pseudomonadota bacterium]